MQPLAPPDPNVSSQSVSLEPAQQDRARRLTRSFLARLPPRAPFVGLLSRLSSSLLIADRPSRSTRPRHPQGCARLAVRVIGAQADVPVPACRPLPLRPRQTPGVQSSRSSRRSSACRACCARQSRTTRRTPKVRRPLRPLPRFVRAPWLTATLPPAVAKHYLTSKWVPSPEPPALDAS